MREAYQQSYAAHREHGPTESLDYEMGSPHRELALSARPDSCSQPPARRPSLHHLQWHGKQRLRHGDAEHSRGSTRSAFEDIPDT
jgi:hypothetical protein